MTAYPSAVLALGAMWLEGVCQAQGGRQRLHPGSHWGTSLRPGDSKYLPALSVSTTEWQEPTAWGLTRDARTWVGLLGPQPCRVSTLAVTG
jgi:hypothetical protein